MKNTLAPEIESLCFEERNGQKVPLWSYFASVTGHRSFAKPGEVEGLPGYDRETIKAAFRHELEQMANQWKEACYNVNAPFILLTGMADGADQLAAEAALELPAELNVKVAAILPMDKELFRLTIVDKERFDSLLKRVHLTYALPLPDNSAEYRAKIADVNNKDTDELRNLQYKTQGKFLALHSHVLFAFWDGIDMPNLIGGTSTVLHFKLEGNTEKQTRSDILTYTSVGPVVQFLTPRNNKENLATPIKSLKKTNEIAVFFWSKYDLWDKEKEQYFFPSREQMTEENRCKTSVSFKPEILGTITRIGDMNRQSMKNMAPLQQMETQSLNYLFEKKNDDPENYSDTVIENFCDAETEALIRHYAYADKLAEGFKNRMLLIVYFYLIAVGAFLFFSALLSSFWEIRQNGWGNNTLFSFVRKGHNTWCDMLFSMPHTTILYGISIILFITIFLFAGFMKNHVYFYRFRAVAEALRVQIFWRIAGMSDCVSGYYRTHQLPETDWLRSVINGLDVLFAKPEDKNFKKTLPERLKFVLDVWINGQLRFFQNRLAKGEPAYIPSNFDKSLMYLWLASIVMFPFIPTWMELFYSYSAFGAEFAIVIYRLLLVSFPIYGLRLVWKRIKQPQSELVRYKQMLFPYDRAILLLTLENETKETHVILRQLGTEAIAENASWLLSVGERKLNLPQ